MSHKALVADSDTTTMQQIAVVLTRAGFSVDSTRDGYRTVSRFLVGMPALVICSERLNGPSGIEVCQQLRGLGTRARLVLLYSRRLTQAEAGELARDVGCDAVICRPFRAADLDRLLHEWGLVSEGARASVAESLFAVPAPTPFALVSETRPEPVPAAEPEPESAPVAEPELAVPETPAAAAVQPPTAPASPLVAPLPIPLPLPVARGPSPPAAPGPAEEPPPAAPELAEEPAAEQFALPDAGIAPDLGVLDAAAEIESVAVPALAPPPVPRLGDLTTVPLPRLIYELYVGTYFGILHLRRDRARRSIYFWAGMPVRVDTDQLSESIGALLVERGKISEAQQAEAEQHAMSRATHVGVALIELGLLRESELLDTLSEQTQRKLVSTLAWRRAKYELVEDLSFATGELLGETDPLRAIWYGVSDHYESTAVLRFFDDLQAHFAVATELYAIQAEHLATELRKSGMETVLDGRTTFREALSRDAMRSVDLARALYVLLVTDMIHAAREPGDPAPRVDAGPAASKTSELVNYQAVMEASDRIAKEYIRVKSATHFEVLGIERDATPDEVEAAYRAVLGRLEKDEAMRGLPSEAVRRARDAANIVAQAWRTLREPASRDRYERKLAAGQGADDRAKEEMAADARRSRFEAEQAYREGMRHLKEGRPVAAREHLEQAAAAHPEEATYRVGIAQAILAGAHGKHEDPRASARAMLDEALRLDPGNVLASLEAAKLMLEEGLHDEARPHIERVLERAPHHRMARKLMREIQLRSAE
jgi:CheY-like chemotaxis protein/tetratricopeptide (TPR) repeat protein